MNDYKFRKLKVWKKSVEFIRLIYNLTENLPKSERYGLVDQIRRAATSVSLNIAEGSGAGSDLEYIRFLKISRRSVFEVIAGLEISVNLNMTDHNSIKQTESLAGEISSMLSGLIKGITSHSSKLIPHS